MQPPRKVRRRPVFYTLSGLFGSMVTVKEHNKENFSIYKEIESYDSGRWMWWVEVISNNTEQTERLTAK
jgi:hypothetical protein